MADRQLGKSWGPWGSMAFTAVVVAYLLIAPVCAHADGLVPSSGARLPAVVPAAAQAAVGAAVAQASADPVPAAAAAAVPAAARAAAAAVSTAARAVVAAAPSPVHAAAVAGPAPAPQAAPAVPHVSLPSVPAPTVPRVNVPRVTLPTVPVPSLRSATSPNPDPAPRAAAGAARHAGSVGAQLADAPRRSSARRETAKPSGHAPVRPRTDIGAAHQASGRVAPSTVWHPFAAGAYAASVTRAGPSSPVHAAGVRERRQPAVLHRAPVRDTGMAEATATAWPTVPTTASLPPGGAGGPSAGGSGGAAGGIAAAVLALAALAVLRGFLPGLLALDVVPWRSALLAFRLERPG